MSQLNMLDNNNHSYPEDTSSETFLIPAKTIRIAVSGDVLPTELEVAVINSREFQRLRRFRQLGTSYLVYPSATHTRFEHSLGVLKKAYEMIDLIKYNKHNQGLAGKITIRQEKLIRLGALFHDIANIPFGHTLEDETHVIDSNQEDRNRYNKYFGKNTKLGKLLISDIGAKDFEILFQILTAKDDPKVEDRKKGETYVSDLGEDAFIVDILKNTVCADLLDYIQRDSFYCGLALTIPDRFLRYMYINKKNGVSRLAIRLWKKKDTQPRIDIISELIQLLETRYFLAERVYFHHTKQISSAMVAASVWHAMRQEKDSLTLPILSDLGDDELLLMLKQSSSNIASELAKGILDRNLYERFEYEIPRRRLKSDKKHDLESLILNKFHFDANNRSEVELQLADCAGLEPGDVLIYCPDIDMNMKLAKMLVTWRDGVKPLKDIDDEFVQNKISSILEAHSQLWSLRIFVKRNSITDSKQRTLLLDWCRAVFKDFEGPNNDGYETRAIRGTIEKGLLDENAKVRIADIDKMVADSVLYSHKSHDQKFSYSFALKLIDKYLSGK